MKMHLVSQMLGNVQVSTEDATTEPFEISPYSNEAPRSEEEIVSYGEAILEMMEPTNAVDNAFKATNGLTEAAFALEELQEELISKMETEAALDIDEFKAIRKIIYTETQPVRIFLEGEGDFDTQDLEVISAEAYQLSPKIAMESVAASLGHILQTLWKHIAASLKVIVERLKAFWHAVVSWFKKRGSRTEKQREQLKQVTHLLQGVNVNSLIANEKIPLRPSDVRNLWIANKNSLARDVPNEVSRLTRAFEEVQAAVFVSLGGWSRELSHDMMELSKHVAGLSKDEAVKLCHAFATKFTEVVKRHEGKISETALRHTGSYLGLVTIENSPKAFKVEANAKTPEEGNIPLLNLQDIAALTEQCDHLKRAHEYVGKHYYEPLYAEIEKFGKDMDAIVNGSLKSSATGAAMRGVFQTYLSRFISTFNHAVGATTVISGRINAVFHTTDYLVEYSLKRLHELGVK